MVQVIYHGHSFVEIEREKAGSILIDPFVNGNVFCDISLKELKKKPIRAIIVTSSYSDHLGDAVDILKQKECLFISYYQLVKKLVEEHNIENTHPMHVGGEHDFGEFAVKLVYSSTYCGVVIRINGKNLYHASDTGLSYDMQLLSEYDNIDLAFLPIGDNFTMGVSDAVIATNFINPKQVVPMHYDTTPLIEADANAFAKEVMLNEYSVPKVLRAGQYIVL